MPYVDQGRNGHVRGRNDCCVCLDVPLMDAHKARTRALWLAVVVYGVVLPVAYYVVS
jgi:hypothetical protein